MSAGIMGAPTTASVDVRDMLCAQALALVAQAIERLRGGGILDVAYNADDVKRDLLIWARERGYPTDERRTNLMRLTKR